MGYRSGVVYAIEPQTGDEALGKWTTFLAEARANPNTELAMSMIDNNKVHFGTPFWTGGLDSKNHAILMQFEDVKWYDSYPEVTSLNALINLTEEEGYQGFINAAYVRIGEDQGDVETRYVEEGYALVMACSYYEIDASTFEKSDNNEENYL